MSIKSMHKMYRLDGGKIDGRPKEDLNQGFQDFMPIVVVWIIVHSG